jgi:hypothetical protein
LATNRCPKSKGLREEDFFKNMQNKMENSCHLVFVLWNKNKGKLVEFWE